MRIEHGGSWRSDRLLKCQVNIRIRIKLREIGRDVLEVIGEE